MAAVLINASFLMLSSFSFDDLNAVINEPKKIMLDIRKKTDRNSLYIYPDIKAYSAKKRDTANMTIELFRILCDASLKTI